jgi:hypothetical protein
VFRHPWLPQATSTEARFTSKSTGGPPDAARDAVVYWHVDDVRAAFELLLAMGTTTHERPTERGPRFVTASVVDPFGNVLGVMENRHYLDVLEVAVSRRTAVLTSPSFPEAMARADNMGRSLSSAQRRSLGMPAG